MKSYHVSGYFQQEIWNKLTELLEFFRRESIGKVSISDAIKICVDHTYKTLHVYEEMVEERVLLKSEISELKNRVRELEGKEKDKIKEIKTAIVGLANCIE
ncbi:hypothetical protein FQP34_22060 [Peribacillus simplex]|uniref:Uncharacterized protein n=1 Tax=Peribacillus simplex TaxID=1478 RepID=A0A8B5XU65_9BACI|nr:hypothetical protein [Peribacillus simplex]TVX77820.1 hypothetical protein FQP34_22060 [Peribacillus simplex]